MSILKKYDFDTSEYIVLSTGAMVLYGIKENANDIDIAVSEKLYNELLDKYECNLKCEYEFDGEKIKVYSFDMFDFCTNSFNKDNINFIEGIPVHDIYSLLKFKQNLNRDKDQNDIKLIKNYLNDKDINSLVLAYLGDAVYELYIRKYLISKGICKVNDLQKEAIKYVSAKAQSDYLEKMFNDNFLTEEEMTIIKRARNHKSHSSKSTDIVTYKRSTGLEALIGYLEINNNITRINEIMNYIVGD